MSVKGATTYSLESSWSGNLNVQGSEGDLRVDHDQAECTADEGQCRPYPREHDSNDMGWSYQWEGEAQSNAALAQRAWYQSNAAPQKQSNAAPQKQSNAAPQNQSNAVPQTQSSAALSYNQSNTAPFGQGLH